MQNNDTFSIKTILTGAQMLFVAFGALVLVPLLTGLDPNVALFTAGIGTLLFQVVTKGQVPIFLASSFAFIAPIIAAVQMWGVPATMGGLMVAGFAYMLLSLLVKFKGVATLHKILPPVVVGPVIMVIGLALAPVAVNMAMGKSGDGSIQIIDYTSAIYISLFSLVVTLIFAVWGKGVFKLIPILAGVVAGYCLSLGMGVVQFDAVTNAQWFAVPNFTWPEFKWQAILFMVPVAIAPAIEHIGDMMAISQVTNKDFLKKPGLHRTLFGDGLATSAASLFGGPPNTTYSEVTGAVMLTKNFNPKVMMWTAVIAIILAFVAKMGSGLQTIPVPVMGGIMILLFGSIAVVGLNTLVKSGDDLTAPRNLSIVALILVCGIGGMHIGGSQFSLEGVSLCAILGIVLNLVLPKAEPEKV
ncbi:uracil-xanthine permease [Pseudoalteromonas sp. NZS127_1]|uniref:Uracil-xanthine permease n=3 Tax=Pseudoalteromonas TaxID=53246 RepID=A0A7X9YFE1_9GAMM|nr:MULTISPECIES: uracil-xanthine permease family protein [Pseudoalteromonas]MBG9995058.1 uracil-xanthine permease [Pseudoalteromonas sp. NZS127_1]MBH0016486.1 uracil-xanthine permease [Pseudoalteromonas sp. NGC95]MBH0021613.1 uracil-xanthine permease [Pseudoalteromonas sp. SWXJ133]MBH0040506.1 uracil-xanthine permease [Pseudoalteromonas sp. SWN166]MBH0040935.1 uracil-xanthine permease [Pseudoalteromonas sp. SWXJZ10B]MBH0047958.1 uracil-xanthine permease [Pseudoalteromonas sp. NZS11_1]MBH0051